MNGAILVTEVSREAYRTMGKDELLKFVDRGQPWAIWGPRGGRYIADGPVHWQVDEWGFYGPDTVRFIGRRERTTYVRPSSKGAMAFFLTLERTGEAPLP